MDFLTGNNVSSTLAGPILAGDLALSVQNGDAAKFPAPAAGQGFLATLEVKNTGAKEIVLCTARVGVLLTIQRAQEGTVALAFAAGDIISMRMTAGLLDLARQYLRQGAQVASANDVTLDPTHGYIQIAGATQINRLAKTGWNGGKRVTLKFNGALTVAHNQAGAGVFVPIFLLGGVNLARTAGQTLTLVYDETDAVFYQV